MSRGLGWVQRAALAAIASANAGLTLGGGVHVAIRGSASVLRVRHGRRRTIQVPIGSTGPITRALRTLLARDLVADRGRRGPARVFVVTERGRDVAARLSERATRNARQRPKRCQRDDEARP